MRKEPRYRVTMHEHDGPFQELRVERDGAVIRSECDGGEPEDQLYYRDWSWVPDALREAYEFGLKDGIELGLKPSYVVGLVMKEGKCVAASRRHKPGNLGLPGGSIEPFDASPFAALQREVKEETGVEVLSARHVFSRVDDTDGNVAWAYVVDEWEGEPRNCEPGIDVSWEVPSRLLEDRCTFREYNAKLFEKLGIATQ